MRFPEIPLPSREPARAARWLAVAVAALHLPMLGRLPLSGDEAYYWQCARHLDWAFFDQPVLVPFLAGLSAAAFGAGETAVRLPALLAGLGSALLVPIAARRLFGDDRAGFWALAALLCAPLFGLGTAYLSTDLFLAFFTLLVPFLGALAVLEDRPALWIPTGLLAGLAGITKYPALFFVPGILLVALLSPAGRRHARRPEPWVGLLLGALAVSPAFLWGAANHWDNFRFQLIDRHAAADAPLAGLARFLAPHLLLASPVLFVLLLVGLAVETRRALSERDLPTLALALPAVSFLLAFSVVALRTKSNAHWGAPAYLPGAIVTARWVLRRWGDWGTGRRRTVIAGIALGGLMTVALHLAVFVHDVVPRGIRAPGFPSSISTDALDRIAGWPELAAELDRIDPAGERLVVADSYSTASLVAFYSGGRRDPLLLPTGGGRHGFAYLYWQAGRAQPGRPGLYVGTWKRPVTREVFPRLFGTISPPDDFTATVDGRPSQSWTIVRGEALTRDPAELAWFTREGRERMVERRRAAAATQSSRPAASR